MHRDCGSRGAGASQGRPKGGPEDKYRLAPVYKRLQQLLPGVPVLYVDDCIGDKVAAAVATAPNGSVLLLENVRFYKEEEANDPEFAKKLAAPAQLYVNDAFGTAHRAHASTEGVTKYLKPAVAGFLLQKELDYLARRGAARGARPGGGYDATCVRPFRHARCAHACSLPPPRQDGAVSKPVRPFAAIVGGSKVSSKIGVIETLLAKCDKLVLGGGMVRRRARVACAARATASAFRGVAEPHGAASRSSQLTACLCA